MHETMAILAGLGLAAACGLRVFLPLFLIGVALRTGVTGMAGFELAELAGPQAEWLASTPALLTLGTATVFEIAAYSIPWVDHLLDTLATPAAVVAGTLVGLSLFPGAGGSEVLDWALAAVAGGGTAGVVQTGSVLLRGASGLATGGLGNFLVAGLELVGALLVTVLATLAPLIGGGLALLLVIFLIARALRHRESAAGNPA